MLVGEVDWADGAFRALKESACGAAMQDALHRRLCTVQQAEAIACEKRG